MNEMMRKKKEQKHHNRNNLSQDYPKIRDDSEPRIKLQRPSSLSKPRKPAFGKQKRYKSQPESLMSHGHAQSINNNENSREEVNK
jgi:hypothetical protein